jgi:glycerophosphoryl diester phosphodiesterase
METIKLSNKKPLMIAHRGLSSFEKENTMAAFIAGGNHTYYGMECDIHVTKDNVIVVCHDSNLERVSGVDLVIEESTYEEIQKVNLYDVKKENNWPYLKVPTFEEYLDCCIRYNKVAVIEFKFLFKEEDVYRVIEIVKSRNYLDKCVFISFVYENLTFVRKYDSNINVQFLLAEYKDELIERCIQESVDIDIHYSLLNQERIDYLHQNNLKINVWTVDDPEIGEKLSEMKVDFITTNRLE